MFTGIIRHIGTIEKRDIQKDGSILLEISSPFSSDLHEGDSVAVDGVCLTLLSHTNTSWTCRLMAETIQKTTLGELPEGSRVNLELPTKVGDGLHGHIVQGHVDGTCRMAAIDPVGDDLVISFEPPIEFISRISPKGSIALNGVSLTVVDVFPTICTVSLMPYTVEHTTFGEKHVGDMVNMETDHTADAKWISGVVVHGDRRGTALGFPTANIQVLAEHPAAGIYACRAMVEGDPTMYAGALHVGPRPTFEGASPSIEVHLLNFSPRDLYGKNMRFTIIKKIRDIAKFESQEALVSAIRQDIAQVSSLLMYH